MLKAEQRQKLQDYKQMREDGRREALEEYNDTVDHIDSGYDLLCYNYLKSIDAFTDEPIEQGDMIIAVKGDFAGLYGIALFETRNKDADETSWMIAFNGDVRGISIPLPEELIRKAKAS